MTVAVIDYGSGGNLGNAARGLRFAAAQAGLETPVEVTSDPEAVRGAARIVLPGQGAFATCLRDLKALAGMQEALEDAVIRGGRPFLGICVGMQLMASLGREHGTHAGLGWIPGEVVALAPGDPALKVPHMGWNELRIEADHPILSGLAQGAHAYFVHSYHFATTNAEHVLACADYGGPITAAVGRDNLVGTQFHPEKSQAAGLRMLVNFLQWEP